MKHMIYVTTIILHTLEWSNPELCDDRGWPISITSMMEIAFDTDVYMCDEISLFIMEEGSFFLKECQHVWVCMRFLNANEKEM